MKKLFIITLISLFTISCKAQTPQQEDFLPQGDTKTIETRFPPVPGFERTKEDPSSFAAYLRTLPLKPKGTFVKYYNGKFKKTPNVYTAVVDMDISPKDLQQCADAVMRLYGEYLYGQKRYDDIKFNFVFDGKPRYYKDYVKGDYSYKTFLKYMDYIFNSANTASLHDELKPVKSISDMKIGDVFIQKGRPFGHAVIVVDMAENKNGEKIYLLAQSYMPAQETQILINPADPGISPWYRLNDSPINTPEWNFMPKDLRRF